MSQEALSVTVQILDKDYRISCSAEEQHGLMDCARMLDRRMREVRQNGRVIGADRIAVMAALNLLYETIQQRSGGDVDVRRLNALQQRASAAVASGVGGGSGSGVVSGADNDKPAAPTTGVDAPDESV